LRTQFAIDLDYCDHISNRDSDSYQIWKSINKSNNDYYVSELLGSTIPYQFGKQGPSLSVSIITRSTGSIIDYAAYSHACQAIHARYHNYRMLPIDDSSSSDDDYVYYKKITPVLKALTSSASDSDYVVWIDAGQIGLSICLGDEYDQIMF